MLKRAQNFWATPTFLKFKGHSWLSKVLLQSQAKKWWKTWTIVDSRGYLEYLFVICHIKIQRSK